MEALKKIDEKKINSDNLYKKMNDLTKEKKKDEERTNVRKRTQNIIIICLILAMIGLANFYSAILRFDSKIVLNKMLKHFIILSLGLVSFTITSKINFQRYKKNWVRISFLFIGILVFLTVAFFPSSIFPTINGGKGWIRIGSISLQITELFKVAYIIMIAGAFAKGKDDNLKTTYWGNFKTVITYLLIFIFLLLCLKDLGTGIHYIMITLFLIFMTDIKDKIIWPLVSVGVFGLLIFSTLFYKFGESFGYKHQRMKIFVDGLLENKYDRFEAYQIYQSLVGFGTGGLFGKGYGNGVQKYSYIPEVETDFAISTFGEEMGLVGMFLILVTLLVLFILIMNVAENSKTYFGKYLAAAIGGYFITQVIINIGVAIGLIPVLGIPLPFISSGGSSLLALSAAMGIIININNSKLKDLS